MSLFSQLLGFCMIGMFFSWILFVIFGQVTVRKLRKKTAMRGKLGAEFASGYDIFNVASALCAPKWFREKFSQSPLAFLAADYEALYKNTSLFDRILGRVFWISFSTSGGAAIILLILDSFGVFD